MFMEVKRVRRKRIRDRGYSDYGLDKKRVREIMAHCQEPENRGLVMRAAQEANPAIAEHLTMSLMNKWSYERILKQQWMCYGKTDFYAYRRYMISILHGLIGSGAAL